MAFNVTPTSGVGPYILSAEFDNTTYIDDVNYSVRVRSSSAVGSCPSRGTAQPLDPDQIVTLITTGSVTSLIAVPSGSCRTFTLEVLRVSGNTSVASSSVYVNNVE